MKRSRKLFVALLGVALALPLGTIVSADDEIEYEDIREKTLDPIGAAVVWDADTQSLLYKLRDGTTGTITVGSNQWTLGNQSGTYDAPVIMTDNVVLTPENDDLEKMIKLHNASKNLLDTFDQPKPNLYAVEAAGETEAVASGKDAADDPSIWVHPTDPEKSKVIATNKGGGILVYDLNGHQLHSYATGKVNNIDVRYGFPLGGQKVDIVAATDRTDNNVVIYKINPNTGELTNVNGASIHSTMSEVYGFAFTTAWRLGSSTPW